MAKLLTPGGDAICVLTGFQTSGAIGSMGTTFTAQATFDESVTVGHSSEQPFLLEHKGTRYNAIVQKTSSVSRDGVTLGSISGKVWPL